MGVYEDRSHPRISVRATADVNSDDLALFHEIENLSIGGICIKTETPEPLGATIEIVINLPDSDEEIITEAEVVWVNDGGDSAMGVRFLNMNKTDKERLEAYLETELPEG